MKNVSYIARIILSMAVVMVSSWGSVGSAEDIFGFGGPVRDPSFGIDAVTNGNPARVNPNGFPGGFNPSSGIRGGGLFSGAPTFGRSRDSLFNLGGLLINGKFDLTFGFPQDVANASRLSNPNPQLVNQALKNRTVLIRDPNSGLVVREAVLANDGRILSRPTDAFGNPVSPFFSNNGLDTEAARQAAKFFLANNNLGSFNKLADQLQGNVDLGEFIAAENLARRELGSGLNAGVLRIQCAKDYQGQPMDLLAGKVNTKAEPKINEAYNKMSWAQRCMSLMSYTLNTVVDPFRPPVFPSQFSIDPRSGVLTVTGLLNSFSRRALAVLFSRSDNTDLCNSDPFVENPIWSEEDVLRQALNPKIYNDVKGLDPDDVNRNIFLTTGANMALPRQLQGAFGAALGVNASVLKDLAFIDNRQSGVATSGQSREIRVLGGNNPLYITLDTNDDKSGTTGLGSQNVRQTGPHNLGFGQSEGFLGDPLGLGRDYLNSFLAAAPDENGKMKRAEEAPATAAHTKTKAVVVNQCISCHTDGPNIISGLGGPYTPVNVHNANGITNLSPAFSIARYKFQRFLGMINAAVPNPEKPGSLLALPTDAYTRANLPRSQEYVSLSMGYPPSAISDLLRRDPRFSSILQVDGEGNIDSKNLSSGAKCAIKRALGDPRRQNQQPPALAQAGPGPGQGGPGAGPGAPPGLRPARSLAHAN